MYVALYQVPGFVLGAAVATAWTKPVKSCPHRAHIPVGELRPKEQVNSTSGGDKCYSYVIHYALWLSGSHHNSAK